MIHYVEVPGGKVLPIEGPDDATDDELIGIAKQHLSTTKATKPAVPNSAPAPDMKAADLPALSSPNQLLNEAKQGTPELKANIPGAYESTQGTNALPTAGGLYDLLSQGDIKGAYNSLPQNVRDVTEIGAPIGAAILAGKAGYDLYKSNQEAGQGGQGIKARTIGSEATLSGQLQTTPAQPAEVSINPKEAKIAKDIENKYGFSWKDIKNNFGVSDVTITNPQEAEMLAGAYQQKQQAPAAQTTTTAPATSTTGTLVSSTEKPVEAVKQPVKPPSKAPKSKVEMPEGWGKGMSWLTTVHGSEGAQAFIDQYNNGKPFATHQEMEKVYKEVTVRPKYSDIPKDIRKERGIIPRAALAPIPPPSLQAAPQMGGGGGGSLIRGLTDPLQLKQ